MSALPTTACTPEEVYARLTETWLALMRVQRFTQAEFLEGLRAALEELEVEIQACKETM